MRSSRSGEDRPEGRMLTAVGVPMIVHSTGEPLSGRNLQLVRLGSGGGTRRHSAASGFRFVPQSGHRERAVCRCRRGLWAALQARGHDLGMTGDAPAAGQVSRDAAGARNRRAINTTAIGKTTAYPTMPMLRISMLPKAGPNSPTSDTRPLTRSRTRIMAVGPIWGEMEGIYPSLGPRPAGSSTEVGDGFKPVHLRDVTWRTTSTRVWISGYRRSPVPVGDAQTPVAADFPRRTGRRICAYRSTHPDKGVARMHEVSTMWSWP
jgi:hypothetical protein